jgi:hypothetical protein
VESRPKKLSRTGGTVWGWEPVGEGKVKGSDMKNETVKIV